MKPSKPVSAPRVTPVTAARLKQVVGGLRGNFTPKPPLGGADGSDLSTTHGG